MGVTKGDCTSHDPTCLLGVHPSVGPIEMLTVALQLPLLNALLTVDILSRAGNHDISHLRVAAKNSRDLDCFTDHLDWATQSRVHRHPANARAKAGWPQCSGSGQLAVIVQLMPRKKALEHFGPVTPGSDSIKSPAISNLLCCKQVSILPLSLDPIG